MEVVTEAEVTEVNNRSGGGYGGGNNRGGGGYSGGGNGGKRW
ncbi:hypothetical protein [Chryseobacterium wanjuense]